MTDDLYARLLPVFISEAEAKLESINIALSSLTHDIADEAAWRELARAAHTLRGNAAMLGLRELMNEADRVESWAAAAPHLAQQMPAMLGACATMRRLLDEVAADASALSTT